MDVSLHVYNKGLNLPVFRPNMKMYIGKELQQIVTLHIGADGEEITLFTTADKMDDFVTDLVIEHVKFRRRLAEEETKVNAPAEAAG